jgi:hypothetical protein
MAPIPIMIAQSLVFVVFIAASIYRKRNDEPDAEQHLHAETSETAVAER